MKPEASSRFYTREKRSGKLLVGKRTECFLVGACLPSIPNGETRACLRLFSENLYLLFPGNLKTIPGTRRRVPVFCKVCAGGLPQALPSLMQPVSFCFNTPSGPRKKYLDLVNQLPSFRPKTPPFHSSATAHPGGVGEATAESLDTHREFWDGWAEGECAELAGRRA